MALLQRPQTLRLGKCCAEVTSLRHIMTVNSKAPMRRFGASGLANQAANRLVQQPRQLSGYGHCMVDALQERRQRTVMRSFLGVGAPEAILVAVVALVVFGPKGLADAAKSLGQTLRAFQPTIREVVEVSNEIKGTLEQELGLDEIREAASMRPTPKPLRTTASDVSNSSDTEAAPSSSSSPTLKPITEDVAQQIDPDIELKRAMSEQAAWGGQTPVATPASTAAAGAAAASQATAAAGARQDAAGSAKDLSALSLEELEAELARRKKAA